MKILFKALCAGILLAILGLDISNFWSFWTAMTMLYVITQT